MIFYVLELQTNETGGANIFVFTDRNQAEQKYHQVLAYASVSEVRKHGAVLMNEDGFILKSETYNHSKPASLDSFYDDMDVDTIP